MDNKLFISDGCFLFSNDQCITASGISILNAIHSVCVMKKLKSESPTRRNFCNGEELIKELEPDYTGIAYYKLLNYRYDLKFLIEIDFITQTMRDVSPYGYGDDEEYELTKKGADYVRNQTTQSL